jgi:hypothetical protein
MGEYFLLPAAPLSYYMLVFFFELGCSLLQTLL